MTKVIALLIVLCTAPLLLAGKTFPMPELAKPEVILIDQEQIIVAQFPNVFIYSANDVSLVKKIGTAGEGPREFARYVRIQPHPDYPDNIVVGSHMKLSFFDRKGKFIREVRAKSNSTANNYKPVGDKIYAAYGFKQDDDRNLIATVSIFDDDLKKIKEVTQWRSVLQFGGKSINATDCDLSGGEFKIYDKKMFVLFREEGLIKIFDTKGNELNHFGYDYERIPVTAEDKSTILEFYKNSKQYRGVYERFGAQFDFPKYYPSAREMNVSGGKIYVITHKQKDGKTEFIVFDQKGNKIKKTMVPFAYANPRDPYPYALHGGKLYQLIDNEDTEEWELHINKM